MFFSSVQPIFELLITICWISLEAIVNSIKNHIETSPPRIVGHEMFFLCLSFAVPSTTRSHLLDDVILDWEGIQSPLVKMLAGFTFSQEMSTSAIDYSLIPMKKAFWALYFWNCFALLERLYIAHVTNHQFTWSASTFSSASLSSSKRSTDTGTQLFTSLAVLEFVLSQPNKTSFLIPLVFKPGACSLTNLSVLDSWVLDFAWVCWESSLPPATSEWNSLIQLSSNEIVGGGRGDTYTFSYMISPVSIIIAFRKNKLGVCRKKRLRSILFDRTWILSVEQDWCRPN